MPGRKLNSYYEKQRSQGRRISAALHIAFLLLTLFGLPSFLTPAPPPEPPSITVELLPVSAISNIKPSETPPVPEKPAEKKPKKEAPPVKTADNTPPPPPKPSPVAPPKPEEKKPEPKKEEPKKEDKKKADDAAFMAALKAVQKTAQEQEKKDEKKDTKEDAPTPQAMSNHYDPSLAISADIKDSVMSQLGHCWSPPIGAKDAQNLSIMIVAEYNTDGSYVKVELAPESRARYESDSFYRAAADSAIRAVKECSPLKNMPPDKYQGWRLMELNFDPRFMLH